MGAPGRAKAICPGTRRIRNGSLPTSKRGGEIIHLDDWPESLAGPEYWLYKNQGDDDDAQEAA